MVEPALDRGVLSLVFLGVLTGNTFFFAAEVFFPTGFFGEDLGLVLADSVPFFTVLGLLTRVFFALAATAPDFWVVFFAGVFFETDRLAEIFFFVTFLTGIVPFLRCGPLLLALVDALAFVFGFTLGLTLALGLAFAEAFAVEPLPTFLTLALGTGAFVFFLGALAAAFFFMVDFFLAVFAIKPPPGIVRRKGNTSKNQPLSGSI